MSERILYLESVAGIAGDMFGAAFLDAGLVSVDEVRALPDQLGYPDTRMEIGRPERAGAMTTHIDVVVPPGEEDPGHRHHHYPDLVRRLEESELDEPVKRFALEVFRLLAEAEGDAHGVPLEKVAFHEVGAVDSVVDVAMAGLCVTRAGADRVLASPVKLGRGTIAIEHGTHPVPPPASARLAVGFPVAPVPGAITRENVELSTPTGLAILRALDPEFVEGWPRGRVLAQGSGSGTLDLGDYPNIVRVTLLDGEVAASASSKAPSTGSGVERAEVHADPREALAALPYATDRVVEIRCNVDDQTGERTGWLTEEALEMGALDAWVEPIVGKKGRPAVCIVLLVTPADLPPFADFLLRRSTTFGIRYSTWDRLKLIREEVTRDTPAGPVSFKVGRTTDGETLKEKPEYEELKEIWKRDPGFRP